MSLNKNSINLLAKDARIMSKILSLDTGVNPSMAEEAREATRIGIDLNVYLK